MHQLRNLENKTESQVIGPRVSEVERCPVGPVSSALLRGLPVVWTREWQSRIISPGVASGDCDSCCCYRWDFLRC